MIRFSYQGTQFDRDVAPIVYTVSAQAAEIAGWGEGVTVDTRQTSATTWTVTAQGEIVTAEVIDA